MIRLHVHMAPIKNCGIFCLPVITHLKDVNGKKCVKCTRSKNPNVRRRKYRSTFSILSIVFSLLWRHQGLVLDHGEAEDDEENVPGVHCVPVPGVPGVPGAGVLLLVAADHHFRSLLYCHKLAIYGIEIWDHKRWLASNVQLHQIQYIQNMTRNHCLSKSRDKDMR